MGSALRVARVGSLIAAVVTAPLMVSAPSPAHAQAAPPTGKRDGKPGAKPDGKDTGKPAAKDGESAGDLLARAQAAADAVDFDGAKKLVARAFAAGGMGPGELARAHRFAGEVAASVGDDRSAREHFVRWILLDPQAALAPGVSPKISNAFEAARKEADSLGGLALSGRLERTPGVVVVIVDARDPVDLIARIRVHPKSGGDDVIERGLRAQLPAVDAETVHVTVTALDKDSNEIWKADLRAGPLAAAAEKGGGIPGWLWPSLAGVSVLAAGGGFYFGYKVGQVEDDLQTLHDNSAMHGYDEAKELEDKGETNAKFANISFVVAGVAAAAAVLTFVLRPKRGVEVAPAPAPGGGTVSATIRF